MKCNLVIKRTDTGQFYKGTTNGIAYWAKDTGPQTGYQVCTYCDGYPWIESLENTLAYLRKMGFTVEVAEKS